MKQVINLLIQLYFGLIFLLFNIVTDIIYFSFNKNI